VSSQFALARTAAQDRLESFGIDPSQTRAGALDVSSRIAEAATRAQAANQTRENVTRAEEATGRVLRSEALNIGRGYPGQIAQSYGTAMNSGNQAVNSALATTASGANTMGTAPQWQGLGNQAVGQWGNALTQGYQNQLGAFKANQAASSGWGSVLGTLGGIGGRMAMGYFAADGGSIEPPPQPQAVPVGPRVMPHPQPSMGVPFRQAPPQQSSQGVPVGPAQGVALSPQGSPQGVDTVPARLNVGEFVIPDRVARWKGEEFFHKLIADSDQKRQGVSAKPQLAALPAERPAIDTTRQAA